MGFLGHKSGNGDPAPVTESRPDAVDSESGGEKGAKGPEVSADRTDSGLDADAISLDAQAGIRKMEATTKVWTKSHIIAAYIAIWVIYFVDSMQQGATGALTPYVTSAFQQHSLTATTGVMSSLLGGILKLPLAKILDIWGRPQGFGVCILLLTLGIIMMAACNSVTTYAAAQVFYWVGYNGLGYTLSIFIADTSALKNRGLMFAFTNSPYIITTWIAGPIATSFLEGAGWRWGFGTFAIVTPVMTLPLMGLFLFNYNKAKKMGYVIKTKSNRTLMQSISYYFIEFDVIGIILLAGGLALFLLPFNLYTSEPDGWESAMILSMLIVGIVMLIGFGVYEKWVAPVQFIPFHLLVDRTVLGSCITAAAIFVPFYIWDSYFSSFLQVVNGLTITEATYVGNIYTIGSCLWSFPAGLFIRYTGRFKPVALYFGMPLTILGVALMINFRQPDTNIGYIVMCQIFIAFAGGALVISEEVAAMAAVTHQHIAVVLAMQAMFSSVGGAIGGTVAAAIWQGIFPVKLGEYLPAESQGNLTAIYGQLPVQMSYPKGTETRHAIERAYGDAQKLMLIASTALLAIALVSTAVWRDIRVKDVKQVKGLVV